MDRRNTGCGRHGLSVIELLVVVSIIGLLISLVLPALHAARESARRSTCMNNLRQVGGAMMQFEQARGRLPSGGEGTDFSVNPPATVFEMQSTLMQILSYMEESYVAGGYQPQYAYNDYAWPANQLAARTIVPSFLCPSDPFRLPDPDGYGETDYMPTVYTDIDPSTGIKNPASRRAGAMALGGLPAGRVVDGLSLTMAFIEDSGKNWEAFYPSMQSPFGDPVFSNGNAKVWDGTKQVTYSQWLTAKSLHSQGLPPGDTATPSGNRAMNRWAEPASAGGISGQANSAPGHLLPPINGNDIPAGGPPGCSWSTANCGPNEEGWSWHPRGTNALMCDGRVRFLAKTVDPRVLRKMVTPDEQLPYADSDAPE